MPKAYFKTQLTGGTPEALDGIDGAVLTDGDGAIIIMDGNCYFYRLDATSGAAESPPNVIAPDLNADSKRWILQFSAPQGEVLTVNDLAVNGGTIPILNSSGQLSLPFAQVPILVNGYDLMSRTFYVDTVNGSDSNSGTSSAPFATIEKAVNSVPVGGVGFIYLTSGQTFTLDSKIYTYNKALFFSNYGDGKPTIESSVIQFGSYKTLANFFVGGASSFCFSRININLPNVDPYSNLSWDSFRQFITYSGRAGYVSVACYQCDIDLGQLGRSFVLSNSFLFPDLGLYSCNITTHDLGYVVLLEGGAIRLHIYNTTIDNSSYWVAGVVRDASTNIPLNVVSNIVI